MIVFLEFSPRFGDMKKEILGHANEIKSCEKRGLALAAEGGLMAEAEIEEKGQKLVKDYAELVAKLEAKEGQLGSRKDLQGRLGNGGCLRHVQ